MSLEAQLRHLDRALALSRMGGDEQLLQEIAKIFLDDYPRMLEELRSAVSAEDAYGIQCGAHALKGSVANFGADDAVKAAFDLEQMARTNHLQGRLAAFRALEESLAQLKPELLNLAEQSVD